MQKPSPPKRVSSPLASPSANRRAGMTDACGSATGAPARSSPSMPTATARSCSPCRPSCPTPSTGCRMAACSSSPVAKACCCGRKPMARSSPMPICGPVEKPVERDRRRRARQHLCQWRRTGAGSRPAFRPRHHRADHAGRHGPASGGQHRLCQRHGGDAGQQDADHRRIARQPADRLRHRRRWQPCPTGGSGPISTAFPTASASMPKARPGMRMCPTSAACGCAKAARCCRPSMSIAAALPACSAGRTGKRCSSSPPNGAASNT